MPVEQCCDNTHITILIMMGVPPLLGSGLQRPPALCECSMASGYGPPTVMIDYYYYHPENTCIRHLMQHLQWAWHAEPSNTCGAGKIRHGLHDITEPLRNTKKTKFRVPSWLAY